MLQQVLTSGVQRHALDGEIELDAQRLQRRGAHLDIAVLDLGIEVIPVPLEEPDDHVERAAKAGESLATKQRLREPDARAAGPSTWSRARPS